MVRPISPKAPKKIPRILKSTRTRLNDLEAVNTESRETAPIEAIEAIRENTQDQFREIPPTGEQRRKLDRKKSSSAKSGKKKPTRFEAKVEQKTGEKIAFPKRSSIDESALVSPAQRESEPESTEVVLVKTAPSEEERQAKERREKREEEMEATNVPAEHISSEQVRKTEERILGKFKKHPVLLFRKYLMVLAVSAIFYFIISALSETRFQELFHWMTWALLLFTTASLVDLFIRWNLNVSIFTEDRVISLGHNGVTNHTLEITPVSSINFLDLKQEGLLKSLLDYGDIHVTSFITESNKDLTLADIANVKKAFAILQRKTHAIKKQQ